MFELAQTNHNLDVSQGKSHIHFQESILTEALHDTPTFEVA